MTRPALNETDDFRTGYRKAAVLEASLVWALSHREGAEIIATLIAQHCTPADAACIVGVLERRENPSET